MHKQCTCFLLPFLLGTYLSLKNVFSFQNKGGHPPPLYQSLMLYGDQLISKFGVQLTDVWSLTLDCQCLLFRG